MRKKSRLNFNLNKSLRIFRHSSIPLALVAGCGVLSFVGADRWILHNLREQRDFNFKQTINRIALQLSENVLTSSYTNIDTLLLRILEEDTHITCLTVTRQSGKILSIASREQPGSRASIQYGLPPSQCDQNKNIPDKINVQRDNFYAYSPITNNNLPLGFIAGHAVNDENDLALIRSIEFILFGAFGIAFLPAFGVLSWSSNRQLELEQDKTTRITALINQLQDAQGRTRAAFEGTNDGWLEWRIKTDQCTPSHKMRRLLGLEGQSNDAQSQRLNRSQLLKHFAVKEDQDELNAFLDQFKQQQHNTNTLSPSGIEARIKPIDLNKIITLRIEAVVTELSHDRPSIIAIVANNITHEKEQQERINHLAFFDTLTGLRNRFSFEQELNNAEAGLQRKDYRLAIFTLDVDNFKFLNDSHGHSSGDEFLAQIASRIQSCTRKNDFAARLGGDEFVIIYKLPYDSDEKSGLLIGKIARKLLGELSRPYQLKTCTSHNTCSIGMCLDSIDPESTATLLDKADIALYKAKELGRNRCFLYQQGMASEAVSKAATADTIKQSIESGLSSIKLQPIVRLNNDQDVNTHGIKIIGHEALFRCPKPKKSMDYLISCAEEAGIIPLITESVLDGIQTEFQVNGCHEDLYISINISPIQFLEADFPERLLYNLRERHINPQRICVEITETAAFKDTRRALAHMTSLKQEGIRFALDDFGTGYASIELLRKLPFTFVKIDRTYLQNIHDDAGIKLIKSIISMAQALDMQIIGEGVETVGQKNILRSLGCEYAQGYLFDKNGNDRKGD